MKPRRRAAKLTVATSPGESSVAKFNRLLDDPYYIVGSIDRPDDMVVAIPGLSAATKAALRTAQKTTLNLAGELHSRKDLGFQQWLQEEYQATATEAYVAWLHLWLWFHAWM